ncbi:hypothetical protein [Herpetosiphon giganteus]|uniref:hypothetical protein n=1 Tax=Herpetosiphon giganteus TaxID=2029754 RepID=UPI001959A801|nr:hypothetical protein [Herpetosiphon giganteus]MBM7845670.1 hypothetical protein [Herpetosiphon giganteus]
MPHTPKACITNLAIPTSLSEFEGMLEKNTNAQGQPWTDLETVLYPGTGIPLMWSGLSQMHARDFLFFYHGVSSVARLRTLLRTAQRQRSDPSLIAILERSLVLAQRYGGTIFGCGLVGGTTEFHAQPPQGEFHFYNRQFAPIERVNLFDNPLPYAQFKHSVPISRFQAVTRLTTERLAALKAAFHASQEVLPAYIRETTILG